MELNEYENFVEAFNKSFMNISIKKNEADNVAIINIDGMIGRDPYSAEDEQNTLENVKDKLNEIKSLEVEEIQVNIHSLGGLVTDGLAIHDELKSHPAKVTTKIVGQSASSATIIFQAGDEREISANAMMLIHRAHSMGMGNANDFEALKGDLEKTDGVISNIYAKRGTKDKDFYMNLMNENNGVGIWLDADEAVELGLADKSVEPKYKQVAMDVSVLKNYGYPIPKNMVDVDSEEKENSGKVTLNVTADTSQFIKNIDDATEKLKAFTELKEEVLGEQDISNEEEDIDLESVIAELEAEIDEQETKKEISNESSDEMDDIDMLIEIYRRK